VLGQHLLVNPRFVVETLQLGDRRQPHQVMVARVVLSQKHQVEGGAVELRVPVLTASRGHVRLHADDGLDAGGLTRLVELDRAVHGAVVGESQRPHAKLDSTALYTQVATKTIREVMSPLEVLALKKKKLP